MAQCVRRWWLSGQAASWPNPQSASRPDVFFLLCLDWESEHLASSLSSAVYYHVISPLKPPVSFVSSGHEELLVNAS